MVVENLKHYLTPSPTVLPSLEGSAENQFKWDTACTEGEGDESGLENFHMSMVSCSQLIALPEIR
jgi:hypothetical protein